MVFKLIPESCPDSNVQLRKKRSPGRCKQEKKCLLFINEVFRGTPEKSYSDQFIELRSNCLYRHSLKGYKLLNLVHTENDGPVVTLVVGLRYVFTNAQGFAVIGGSSVTPSPQVSIDDTALRFSAKFDRRADKSTFLLQDPSKPEGLILVRGRDNSLLPDILLTHAKKQIKLNNVVHIKMMIEENIDDMLVYSNGTRDIERDIYEDIYANFHNKDFLLAFPNTEQYTKVSLSRCTMQDKRGFLPRHFLFSDPTPGAENLCHYHLQLPLVSEGVAGRGPENEGAAGDACAAVIPAEEDNDAETSIHQILHRRVQNDLYASIETPDWESTDHFDQEWVDQMYIYQSDLLPITTIQQEKVKTWFRYKFNATFPAYSTYLCRLCNENYDRMGLDKRYKPSMADNMGVLRETKVKNWKTIYNHDRSPSHQNVIGELQKEYLREMPKQAMEYQQTSENRDEAYFAPTARMLRTALVIAKHDFSLESHSALVQLQKINGVELGTRFTGRDGATSMIHFLSDVMHSKLIRNLTSNRAPVSLIVDGSTDSTNQHVLVVLLQTVLDGKPTVSFYGMIPLGVDETARGLYNALTREWAKEPHGFLDYMRENLVSYISDGANVMSGSRRSLYKELKTNFLMNGPLYQLKCQAHRLHLAVRNSMGTDDIFLALEVLLNGLFVFYNSGHKRKNHLRALANDLGLSLYNMNYVYPARWLSSELKSTLRVKKSWKALILDFEEIIFDERLFDRRTRAKAQSFLQQLGDPHFLLQMHFTLDVMAVMEKWSLELQQRYGLVIDQEPIRQRVMNKLSNLKTTNGPYLQAYLEEVACWRNNLAVVCDTTTYYQSELRWQEVVLSSPPNPAPNMTEFRHAFIDSLQSEITSYFPLGNFQTFLVFDNRRFPQEAHSEDDSTLTVFGQQEVVRLADIFRLPEAETLFEWRELLERLLDDAGYCRKRGLHPADFWTYYLTKKAEYFGANVKRLIQIVLSIPTGSADAERAFSHMNIIKTKSRNRMSIHLMNSLLRIKLNSAKKLEEFPAAKLAKTWVLRGHPRTDTPFSKQRPREDEEDMEIDDYDEFETDNLMDIELM